jgi:hypothetical protein
MMRLYTLLLIASITCTSCLTSLYPFISNAPGEGLPLKQELIGRWQWDSLTITIEPFLTSKLRMHESNIDETMSAKKTKTTEQKLDSIYFTRQYLTSYTRKGVTYVYESVLTEIGGTWYMEFLPYNILTPNKDAEPEYYYYRHTFTLARLDLKEGRAQLDFLDGDYIKQQIRSGHMRIKHEWEPIFNIFVISAPTQELRSFISKYGNDRRLYKSSNMISLIKK